MDKAAFEGIGADLPSAAPGYTPLNQQAMLHEVVGAVRGGTYSLGRGASCTKTRKARPQRSRKVVVIGHSAGGGIVEGYPGTYHDVAAMVQADWSGFDPLSGAPAPSVPPEVGQQLSAGKDYISFFADREECESFNQYRPGVVKRAIRIACDPRDFVATPAGEFLGFDALGEHNKAAIKTTGDTPVLLTWGDHDYIFPPDSAAAEYKYWVDTCSGCDVTAAFYPRTGHLFMVHRSLTDWVRDVTGWLESRGIVPAP